MNNSNDSVNASQTSISGISLPLNLNGWTKEKLSATNFVESPDRDMVIAVTWGDGFCNITTWNKCDGVYLPTGTTLGVSKVKPRVKE